MVCVMQCEHTCADTAKNGDAYDDMPMAVFKHVREESLDSIVLSFDVDVVSSEGVTVSIRGRSGSSLITAHRSISRFAMSTMELACTTAAMLTSTVLERQVVSVRRGDTWAESMDVRVTDLAADLLRDCSNCVRIRQVNFEVRDGFGCESLSSVDSPIESE